MPAGAAVRVVIGDGIERQACRGLSLGLRQRNWKRVEQEAVRRLRRTAGVDHRLKSQIVGEVERAAVHVVSPDLDRKVVLKVGIDLHGHRDRLRTRHVVDAGADRFAISLTVRSNSGGRQTAEPGIEAMHRFRTRIAEIDSVKEIGRLRKQWHAAAETNCENRDRNDDLGNP